MLLRLRATVLAQTLSKPKGRWELINGRGKPTTSSLSANGFPLMAGPNFQTIGWQSDCNFNPPAISRWTIKCPENVADSSCELLDSSRKKFLNIGWYPPGHEHGYLSAGKYWGMHVRVLKMNGNLLYGGASIHCCFAQRSASVLRPMRALPPSRPPQSTQCSAPLPPSFAIVLQSLLGFRPSHFARLV